MARWVVGLAIVVALCVVGLVFSLMLQQPAQEPLQDSSGAPIATTTGGVAGHENTSADGVAGSSGPGKSDAAATAQKTSSDSSDSTAVESGTGFKISGSVVAVDGTPVVGAAVRFLGGSESESAESVLGSAQSDDEGKFVLRLVQAVSGSIEATAERHATVAVPWQPPSDETAADDAQVGDGDNGDGVSGDGVGGEAAAAESTATTDSDEASVGEEGSDVRIELPYETAITGTVTLPEDLEEAQFYVTIQRYSGPYGWHEPKVMSFDDKKGEFYIGGIRAATYHLWTHCEGTFRSARYEVAVAQNERRAGVDFTLQPGLELTCRAFDKRSGFGLADVLVYMPREHVPGTVNFPTRSGPVDDSVRNAGTTDASGAVVLRDLPPGKHIVRFVHPGFKARDIDVVVAEGAAPVEVTMEEGTGVRGQAIDETGAPMEGVVIMAVQMMPQDRDMAHMGQATVDENGDYHIPNLLAGGYVVLAMIDEQQQPKMKMTTVVASKDVVVDFVEVQEFATLRGRTVDPRGEPLSGMHVTRMMIDQEGEFSFETVVSDADGNYEIRNLKIGEYMLGVGAGTGGNFAVTDEFEVKAHINYERDLTFHDLQINGTVTSKVSKEPIANAELLLLDSENTDRFLGRAEADEKGVFHFGGLAPGGYLVYVLGSGHQPLGLPVELQENVEAKPLDLELELGAIVKVSVTDPDGSPVDGALVLVLNEAGEQVNQGLAPLTAGGRYQFGNLVPGTHVVRVTRGEEQGVATFVAKTGQTHPVDVQLIRPKN
ncbi:MAG: carboxypeptidase regulatory-like domain-containing protein [Planctomycetota bacterium]